MAEHKSSSNTDLCTAFKRRARGTWRLLARGSKQFVRIPEETITTLNVLRFRESKITRLHVKSFTKQEEAKHGADWEWWFGTAGRWLGFRVQAKVIDPRRNTFDHLHYRSSSGSQCERLIHVALNANPPRIPMYCLYAHWRTIQQITAMTQYDTQLFGCSLVSPFVVHALAPSKRNSLLDLGRIMSPWHVLVCGERLPKTLSQLEDRVAEGSKALLKIATND